MVQLIIFYSMFAILLVLIGLTLRESVIRRRRVDVPMLEAARISAESAKASAEAAHESAEAAKILAAQLEKKRA